MDQKSVEELNSTANWLRKQVIEMVYAAGSGHCGGSLSICELLSVLYYDELTVDPMNPKMPERDRFILSKGHAAPALYAILAKKGFIPISELKTLRKFGSKLQGHPDSKKMPGVEVSSGSLGMGISFGIGNALGALLNGYKYRTFVLTGCGELDEGQNWEALMYASYKNLDNLTVIVDYNKVQLDGKNDEIVSLESLSDKFSAFQWNVIECDGHSVENIRHALIEARKTKRKPTVIIAHTVKGKGVSFMEDTAAWHGKPLNDEEYSIAIEELSQ